MAEQEFQFAYEFDENYKKELQATHLPVKQDPSLPKIETIREWMAARGIEDITKIDGLTCKFCLDRVSKTTNGECDSCHSRSYKGLGNPPAILVSIVFLVIWATIVLIGNGAIPKLDKFFYGSLGAFTLMVLERWVLNRK